MTCYPTSQTIAYQNQYTRVICEYPSMLSPTARLVPFRHQFHFPGGRWFFTLHGAQTPTSSVPYASPTYYSLARPDQIWTPRRPTPDSKPKSASRHSSTTH